MFWMLSGGTPYIIMLLFLSGNSNDIDIYSCEITRKLKHEHIVKLGTYGLIDSIRGLLTNYDITSHFLLNKPLRAF